jgi:Transglutaminase-like superfamily
MRRARKFLLLPLKEKLLLFKATLLVLTSRVALALLPFKIVRRFLSRVARVSDSVQCQQSDVDRIVWATAAAVRRLPGFGTCLTQAMTAYVLLARVGFETDLRIGVTRNHEGKFVAHAWLQKGDRILIGELGEELDRYTPFPALKGLERQNPQH